MKDAAEIFKALGNPVRLEILSWLKNPGEYFGAQKYQSAEHPGWEHGVCVDSIREKAGLTQSTISHYLDLLKRVGLLESERLGKWTYYRRNEEAIKELSRWVREEL